MDSNMIPVLVMGLGLCCVIDSSTAGCVDDLHGDSDYEKCKKGVATFVQEQEEKKLSMCSMQGQEAIGCWLVYAIACPDVLDSPGTLDGDPLPTYLKHLFAGLPSSFHQSCPAIEDMSRNPYERDLIDYSGECAAVQACLGEGDGAKPEYKKGPTPVTVLPSTLDLVCNYFYPKIKCLDGLRDQCPDQVSKLEQSMLGNVSRQEATPGVDASMHSRVLAYMREECPNIPPLFSNNVCFNMKLNSKKFVNCYKSAGEMYSDIYSCPAFHAIRKCIEENMLLCGRAKLRAFVQGAHVFMYRGATCDVGVATSATDKDGSAIGGSGGSAGIQGSIAIISFLLILLLAYK